MMKKFWVSVLVICIFQIIFCDVKLIDYYPKILTLNNDGLNENVFFKYLNDEDRKLTIKIYDIKGALVWEEKITGSLKEQPTQESIYIWSWHPLSGENLYSAKLPSGVYIFVLSDEEKIISQGSFVVAK
ncbi:MAG: gliding motility-associated C-terminal domain-containing protein [Endomicrobiia bacterium]